MSESLDVVLASQLFYNFDNVVISLLLWLSYSYNSLYMYVE